MTYITQYYIYSNTYSGVYEVTRVKNKITFDLPVLVAFFVYSYAKERMLTFYYDFLDKVLDREDFEMIEMDTGEYSRVYRSYTLSIASMRFNCKRFKPLSKNCLKAILADSFYFACSAMTLKDAVRPEKIETYNQLEQLFLAIHPDPMSEEYDQRKPGELLLPSCSCSFIH